MIVACLLPVIYFIHGGGYALGQNSYYGGRKLLADEVVLVTVQYRLGPLGFLCTGDDTISANNAMKDMVQGLRWVQENIESFGGDPNQVTVMGESAGSASALYMLISPLAQGLFNKVIAMSGTPLQEWAIDRNPLDSATRIATLLNCATETSQQIIDCFKGMDWMPLVRASLAVVMEDFIDFKMILSGTTPCIEGDVPGAFLPDDPLKLMAEGPLPNASVLLGAVQHEGMLPLAAAYVLKLETDGLLNDTKYLRDYMLGDILITYGVNERRDGGSVSQSLAVGYFPPGSSRQNFTEMQYHLMDLLSAVFMKAPVLRTADILSRRLPAVYLYSFEHYNRLNSLYHLAFTIIEPILGFKKPAIRPGTMHADDLMYMFDFPFILNANDITFSRMYCKMWTNFVIHGTPTPEPSENVPEWPTYNTDTQQYMKLALHPEVKTDYMDSWRQGMLPE
ncbi:Carboxylesterase 4A [Orchesella cincta]|uniref:Carboxylic ester hydrolase n=1 Tax=Orchesella cincta TaxID=48709 RepID=A0A1D2NER4_ORCCI|nr:Carboxylesterase 4A [Orchesella cincta]